MKVFKGIVAKLTSLSMLEKIIITIIILIFVAASVFTINHFMWHRYIDKAFSPFLNNDKIEFSHVNDDGWTHYDYSDFENGYYIQIGVPPYLKYGGTVTMSMQFKERETGSFRGRIMVFHSSVRITQKIVLGLGEQTGAGSSILGSAVNKNGQPLGRNPRDSEAFYTQWLALYDKHYYEAMEMLKYFKEFFGEDALR